MLGIKRNGEFLDLVPGQSLEFERNSPVFLIDNVFGEYSTPISIPFSEKNVRLLGNIFFNLTIKERIKFDVQVTDDGMTVCDAILVIEKQNNHYRNNGKNDLSGFLLSGMSLFFNKIKDKKANSLLLGGAISLTYTTSNPTDGSNGMIQYFNSQWANPVDYTPPTNNKFIVAPFINDADDIEESMINKNCWYSWSDFLTSPMTIFPNVKFIFIEIFKEFGFEVDTSAMDDTFWHGIYLLSTNYVLLSTASKPITTYVFKISSFFSSEVLVKDLIIELCKKYGWYFTISNNVVSIKPLKKIDQFETKDFSAYVNSSSSATFEGSIKTFEFKNGEVKNDGGITSNNYDNLKVEGSVIQISQLPSPSARYDYSLIYVYGTNKYYKIGLDSDNNRVWDIAYDNIGDYTPPNATDTIETKACTVAVIKRATRIVSSVQYYAYLPYCNIKKGQQFGIRTLIYPGTTVEFDDQGNALGSGGVFPGLSCVTNNGVSNTFPFNDVFYVPPTINPKGIIEYWYKSFIEKTALVEILEEVFYLPIHELSRLNTDTIINIFNIPYLIRSYIESRPYKGYIKATLQRLLLDKRYLIGSGITYLKFVWENEANADSLIQNLSGTNYSVTYSNKTAGKPIVKAFVDYEGTIPKQVTNLFIPLKRVKNRYDEQGINSNNFVLYKTIEYDYSIVLNGNAINISNLIALPDETSVYDEFTTPPFTTVQPNLNLKYFDTHFIVTVYDGRRDVIVTNKRFQTTIQFFIQLSNDYIIIP